MFDRLDAMKKRYEELSVEIGKSEVIANQDRWRELVKEHAELEEIVSKFDEYRAAQAEAKDLREICLLYTSRCV